MTSDGQKILAVGMNLCRLFHRNQRLPCLLLKTSRFFPEVDDRKEVREIYEDASFKANEFLYRRVDTAL